MNFRIKQRRWLYLSLSILSLYLAVTITPTKASEQLAKNYTSSLNAITSPAESTNWLEKGRNLYQSGRFTEAVTAWQMAAQQYNAQGERTNFALSLSYLSSAQQELN